MIREVAGLTKETSHLVKFIQDKSLLETQNSFEQGSFVYEVSQ